MQGQVAEVLLFVPLAGITAVRGQVAEVLLFVHLAGICWKTSQGPCYSLEQEGGGEGVATNDWCINGTEYLFSSIRSNSQCSGSSNLLSLPLTVELFFQHLVTHIVCSHMVHHSVTLSSPSQHQGILNGKWLQIFYMSHVMRKPVHAICKQRRRSACISAQSNQCLCCSLPR